MPPASRYHQRLIREGHLEIPSWCVVGAWAREPPFGPPQRIVRLSQAYAYLQEDGTTTSHRVRYEHLPLWQPVDSPRNVPRLRGRTSDVILYDDLGWDQNSDQNEDVYRDFTRDTFRQEYMQFTLETESLSEVNEWYQVDNAILVSPTRSTEDDLSWGEEYSNWARKASEEHKEQTSVKKPTPVSLSRFDRKDVV